MDLEVEDFENLGGFPVCAVCGVSGNRERLVEVVSLKEKGVLKVCENCAARENLPVLKRPTTFQLKKSESASDSGSFRSSNRPVAATVDSGKAEMSLRDIVDRKYEQSVSEQDALKKPRPDLVEHFNWIIMRARKKKKLTQEKLASEISESVAAVKMAERGVLPEDDYRLVSKFESFLDIRLIKDRSLVPDQTGHKEVKQPSRILNFDAKVMDNLTIDDLRRMREAREKEAAPARPEPGGESAKQEEKSTQGENSPSVFSEDDFGRQE